jgi:hypothetical protein
MDPSILFVNFRTGDDEKEGTIWTLATIAIGWTCLTLYAESNGPSKEWNLGNDEGKKVLVVFDPDPFYNLDEQVCLSFAKALSEQGISVKVVTVAGAVELDQTQYAAVVYCANTYNWRPDWSITSYIKDHPPRPNQGIVAITLGAGSTESAKKNFENLINENGGKLVSSYSSWLWRPNDETRMKENNVVVATSMAYTWGKQFAEKIK